MIVFDEWGRIERERKGDRIGGVREVNKKKN